MTQPILVGIFGLNASAITPEFSSILDSTSSAVKSQLVLEYPALPLADKPTIKLEIKAHTPTRLETEPDEGSRVDGHF
jgi:hypothetical protein